MKLRKLRPFLYPLLIALVFIFALIGYVQTLGKQFNFAGVLFTIFNFFIMNDADPTQVASNGYILAAKYIAAILVGVSLFTLSYTYIRKLWLTYKIRLRYSGHIIVFSLDHLGYRITRSLLEKGYPVVVVEPNKEAPAIEETEESGAIVIQASPFETKTLDMAGLGRARVCILAHDADETNIAIAAHLTAYPFPTEKAGNADALKIFLHIANIHNRTVIKDYFDINNTDEHYDLHIISGDQLAAQKIYDEYPPHRYFRVSAESPGNSIAVIGCDKTAEAFLLENIILSHYHDTSKLKVYLVDKEVDQFYHEFSYLYPFYPEFIELIPVKLLNGAFFANFTWQKIHIEQLSQVKAAYFFGRDDAEIMNQAAAFRQFLYTQTRSISQVPIIASLPEENGIYDFLNNSSLHKDEVEQVLNNTLNQFYVKRKSDTFSGNSLIEESESIDMLSRVINFFYAVNYELAGHLKQAWQINLDQSQVSVLSEFIIRYPETHPVSSEPDFEKAFLEKLAAITGKSTSELMPYASIRKQWNLLNNRKKDSNRYAARHMQVKLYIMQQIGCVPVNRENIIRFYPRLAPVEHDRWCAEKMVYNYKYGPYTANRQEKTLLKEVMKIHDQLIPYEKLTQEEKDKDQNLFLLLPLLDSLKKNTQKS
ncbi:MAG TPA: NAD-binding protein [Sediminibacterium sp.]|nr:NAD-binding protein [Sediminibacterium sp.]